MTEAKVESAPEIIKGEVCPICGNKTLSLMEAEREVPYFGVCYLFSMDCEHCKYHKADVEAAEERTPVKYTYEINNEDDMRVRIVKSSFATVKFPHLGSIEPGESSNGYITNIEGLLNRIKNQIESIQENEDDAIIKKKCKSALKKIMKVMWGHEKQKLIIEDPSGNSAIISDKAVKGKL
ncbi:ZPR1 zinc finger domain-containing protein [Candidatus Woesearchaeota archaeon]|nr:ZPR1 zinc finger domain-containing protein [Candidatus Woesearchaeota archaeon]